MELNMNSLEHLSRADVYEFWHSHAAAQKGASEQTIANRAAQLFQASALLGTPLGGGMMLEKTQL